MKKQISYKEWEKGLCIWSFEKQLKWKRENRELSKHYGRLQVRKVNKLVRAESYPEGYKQYLREHKK